MQCPDCKQLRHLGECEPQFFEDEPGRDEPADLEMLRADAELAWDRYLKRLAAEGQITQENVQ
jgi:hypothetical protein